MIREDYRYKSAHIACQAGNKRNSIESGKEEAIARYHDEKGV
jgi:hypothetical protein